MNKPRLKLIAPTPDDNRLIPQNLPAIEAAGRVKDTIGRLYTQLNGRTTEMTDFRALQTYQALRGLVDDLGGSLDR